MQATSDYVLVHARNAEPRVFCNFDLYRLFRFRFNATFSSIRSFDNSTVKFFSDSSTSVLHSLFLSDL